MHSGPALFCINTTKGFRRKHPGIFVLKKEIQKKSLIVCLIRNNSILLNIQQLFTITVTCIRNKNGLYGTHKYLRRKLSFILLELCMNSFGLSKDNRFNHCYDCNTEIKSILFLCVKRFHWKLYNYLHT